MQRVFSTTVDDAFTGEEQILMFIIRHGLRIGKKMGRYHAMKKTNTVLSAMVYLERGIFDMTLTYC